MWDHVWDNKGVWQLKAIKIVKDLGNKANGRENGRIRKKSQVDTSSRFPKRANAPTPVSRARIV